MKARHIAICQHALSEDEWNLLTEVFATALLFTKDETGDFANDARELALNLGITNEELDRMGEEVERVSG